MNALNMLFEQVEQNPEVMIEKLNLSKLVITSSSLATYNTYKVSNCEVININRYPNLKSFKFEYNLDLILMLKSEEYILQSIIQRYLSGFSKKKATLSYIKEYYYKVIHFAFSILNQYEIGIVFTWDTPHSPLNYALFSIAKKIDLVVIGSKFIPSENYTSNTIRYISTDFPALDYVYEENYAKNLNYSKKIGVNDLSKISLSIFNKYKNISNDNYTPNFGDKWTPFTTIKSILKRNRNYFFTHKVITKAHLVIPYIRTFTYDLIYKFYLVNYINKHSQTFKINHTKTKYIYFPLHFQPESTTVPLGGYFDNQILIIDALTKLIPDDWIIIVKEHPSYIYRLSSNEGMHLSRSRLFYDKLLSNNKIKFIGFTGNTLELTKNCESIVTVSGTIVLEALAFNKPAIVFGNYMVGNLPNAYRINSSEDIVNAINSIKSSKFDYSKEYMALLKAFEKITIPINISNLNNKSKVKGELSSFFDNLVELDGYKEIKCKIQ